MEHIPHKHLENRKKNARDAQEKPTGFNNWLAVKITNFVGTMWCAYTPRQRQSLSMDQSRCR